jgi:hypothetical protein
VQLAEIKRMNQQGLLHHSMFMAIIRMGEERIPKKVLNGTFHNTRPVGRP